MFESELCLVTAASERWNAISPANRRRPGRSSFSSSARASYRSSGMPLEIAALMLGSDKSRGYSLEMICADFLAGAVLETGRSQQNLGCSASNGYSSAASETRAFTQSGQHQNSSTSQKGPRIRKAPKLYARLHREILERNGWRCQKCGCSKNLDIRHM